REQLALHRFEPGRATDLDLLPQASNELEPLLLEAFRGLGAAGLDRLQDRLGEIEKLAGVGDRLRLTADRDQDSDVPGDRREDLAFGRRAAGLLPRGGRPAFAEETLGLLEIAVRLLK